MSPDLEQLLKALDAAFQAGPEQVEAARSRYEQLLDDAIEKDRAVRREALDFAIRQRYSKWLAAQKPPPTMPPAA